MKSVRASTARVRTASSGRLVSRKRAFIADLRRAGVSKARSERVARKFITLAQPHSIGKLEETRKGRRTYTLRGSVSGGHVVVHEHTGKGGRDGRVLVVFRSVKPKGSRRRTQKT